MSKRYFVTGTGTGIGKTVISAILTEALRADYWKPVQAGSLENTDTDIVRGLVSNSESRFHPEAFRLKTACSPHAAAAIDGVDIRLGKILLPGTDNSLVMEGAGGLMVPLNSRDMVIDLISEIEAEVILISKNYLGSINHTLLSWEALQIRDIRVKGIIFNGQPAPASEEFILSYTGYKMLGRVNEEPYFDKVVVKRYADLFAGGLE